MHTQRCRAASRGRLEDPFGRPLSPKSDAAAADYVAAVDLMLWGNAGVKALFDLDTVWVGVQVMDTQRVAGGVKKAIGTVKMAAGKATGNRRLEANGRAEKTEGRVRSAVGKAKDAVRDIVGRH